ncbi:hypothetical protein Thein_1741 [Thermodesulfatator indicus DSM 15286]|uniref:Uncharacterized protein n=1 Tax=Thermodesulfatator indicus (strain DSM 15286 / JCM 11887 / CIR29812) TaxID=667014 RepID=F8ABK2_THEID|nr:putative glycoside hydrolase family 15 protein [Thermodesulfatator indicus]AEH45599.1 hypothetical protein Thein_1741 [Thermodesulfatator indicus DSM 15286]
MTRNDSPKIVICFVVPVILFFLITTSLAKAQSKFGFPETTNKIAIFADQLPSYMTEARARFAATHYVGSQKLTLGITKRLRKYNPKFVVLHYHLAIWQQQPKHQFIIDGKRWGNDWDFVNKHEDWFWHNEKGKRVRSKIDGKYLMNIMNPEFRKYWKKSIARQIIAGEYQGVFLDSASPALLPWETAWADPRLARKAACSRRFEELNGLTWCEAYEIFMADLTGFMEFLGFATLPNIGALFTTWDKTDYYTTASGAFMEHAFQTRNAKDWKMAMDRTLKLINRDKIVIFQSYLKRDADYKTRMYYLGCYLLIKGRYSYLNYFAKSIFSWYPEWDLKLGKPIEPVKSIKDLERGKNLYCRKYEKGEVCVNISRKDKVVNFKQPVFRVIPQGGGPVSKDGKIDGMLMFEKGQKFVLKPWEGLVVVYDERKTKKMELGSL